MARFDLSTNPWNGSNPSDFRSFVTCFIADTTLLPLRWTPIANPPPKFNPWEIITVEGDLIPNTLLIESPIRANILSYSFSLIPSSTPIFRPSARSSPYSLNTLEGDSILNKSLNHPPIFSNVRVNQLSLNLACIPSFKPSIKFSPQVVKLSHSPEKNSPTWEKALSNAVTKFSHMRGAFSLILADNPVHHSAIISSIATT